MCRKILAGDTFKVNLGLRFVLELSNRETEALTGDRRTSAPYHLSLPPTPGSLFVPRCIKEFLKGAISPGLEGDEAQPMWEEAYG